MYLKVHVRSHGRYQVQGHDLAMELPVTPWEAALGAGIAVRLLDGEIQLKIPSGSQTGKKMRLKGKGLPRKGGQRGDMFVQIKIVIPETISAREKELFQELAKASRYNPRGQ